MLIIAGFDENIVQVASGPYFYKVDLDIWDGPMGCGYDYSTRIALILGFQNPQKGELEMAYEAYAVFKAHQKSLAAVVKIVRKEIKEGKNPLSSARNHRNDFKMKLFGFSPHYNEIKYYIENKFDFQIKGDNTLIL